MEWGWAPSAQASAPPVLGLCHQGLGLRPHPPQQFGRHCSPAFRGMWPNTLREPLHANLREMASLGDGTATDTMDGSADTGGAANPSAHREEGGCRSLSVRGNDFCLFFTTAAINSFTSGFTFLPFGPGGPPCSFLGPGCDRPPVPPFPRQERREEAPKARGGSRPVRGACPEPGAFPHLPCPAGERNCSPGPDPGGSRRRLPARVPGPAAAVPGAMGTATGPGPARPLPSSCAAGPARPAGGTRLSGLTAAAAGRPGGSGAVGVVRGS